MQPKFGTSGLRGLVTDLTDALVSDYVNAFIAACDTGGQIFVGWDLRDSSPRIAEAVISAVRAAGVDAVVCKDVPTPALALASLQAKSAAIMVTGSHIPADRNGLKFYIPTGEIGKEDEARILKNLGQQPAAAQTLGAVEYAPDCLTDFCDRYLGAFGATALKGLRIGIYEHSSVARDVLGAIISALGAETLPLARSETFIPVDTEALDPVMQAQLKDWVQTHALDAIVSTDGDGDRPMVVDENGAIVLGDVLGPITAAGLHAAHICTPVSSNSLVDHMAQFQKIDRTRIGSPFVIAAMEQTLRDTPSAAVVGYEANGGFLLGFDATGAAGVLSPLMTRDSVLPIVAPLVEANKRQISLSALAAALPARFTAADRLTEVNTQAAATLLSELTENAASRHQFFDALQPETDIDTTDGLRISFESGDVVHLRPSGNAPEFRCYAESNTTENALLLVKTYLNRIQKRLQT